MVALQVASDGNRDGFLQGRSCLGSRLWESPVQAKDHPIMTTVGAAESPCVLRRVQYCSLCDGRELPKLSRQHNGRGRCETVLLGVFP